MLLLLFGNAGTGPTPFSPDGIAVIGAAKTMRVAGAKTMRETAAKTMYLEAG
jgi:hypothetical protein